MLDFSTNGFDAFTLSSIGLSLCRHCGLSNDASFTAYCGEADETSIVKLFSDLLEYYEAFCKDRPGEQNRGGVYEKCKEVIKRESSSIQLDAPAIIAVNRDYIASIASRANCDVDNSEYDNTITIARTLLEEVLCHAIEGKDETPSDRGEIGRLYKLYNQFKTLYNMHQARDMDVRINMLLSGLEKILSAITQMRNESSDSHGVGANRIKISEHHARPFVNSSVTMADLILSVEKNSHEQ